MKVLEKIKIIESIIEEKQKHEIKDIEESERVLVSKQIFVLKQVREFLMHSIGLKTEEEKSYERQFQSRE